MALFVLTMVNGPAYDRSRPRREQRGWDEHAAFMDGLLAEGFVVLGGPIGDGENVMLVVEADSERDARARAQIAPDAVVPCGLHETRDAPFEVTLPSTRHGLTLPIARAEGCRSR